MTIRTFFAWWCLGLVWLAGTPVMAQLPGMEMMAEEEKAARKAAAPAEAAKQAAPATEQAADQEKPPLVPSIEVLTQEASRKGVFKIRLDNPRATMRTFMVAMNLYLEAEKGKDAVTASIAMDNALKTLNLSQIPEINREIEGPQAAVYLKEYLDRVIPIDLNKVPRDPGKLEEPGTWMLQDTNVTITKVVDANDSELDGKWLFTPGTVSRAKTWFEAVKKDPYVVSAAIAGASYEEPWVNRNLPPWAFNLYFGVHLWQWIGLLVFIFVGLASRMVVKLLARGALVFTHKTATNVDTLIVERCSGPIALVVNGLVWMFALHLLNFTGTTLTVMTYLVRIVVSLGLIWFFYRLVEVLDHFVKRWIKKKGDGTGMDQQLARLLVQTLKVFVLVFGVLLAVQNLGVNVFSLLAGLGIFGAALAFAAQDTLKNFFGSILIMIDRPFKVGDWVIVGGSEGTVEDIGFRSTRIRTFYNSLITVPNGEVAIKAVDNMGLRTYRRYKTTLGVTYDTPPEKIEAFCEGIKNIIIANPHTRKDYFHVVANDFGGSSINIMLYMFFRVPDWSKELVERHHTICEIINLAKRLEVEFAFPTQTLHIESLVKEGVMKQHPDYTRDDIAAGAKDFAPGGSLSHPGGTGLYVPPSEDPEIEAITRKGGDGGE